MTWTNSILAAPAGVLVGYAVGMFILFCVFIVALDTLLCRYSDEYLAFRGGSLPWLPYWDWGKRRASKRLRTTTHSQSRAPSATTQELDDELARILGIEEVPEAEAPTEPLVEVKPRRVRRTLRKAKRVVQEPSRVRCQTVVPRNFPVQKMVPRDLRGAKKLGGGGEAEVFRFGTLAYKIFREPSDEYYRGKDADQVNARRAAEARLRDYPKKLDQFPIWLGSRVVGPTKLIQTGRYPVGGYEMPYVRGGIPLTKFADPDWKRQKGVDLERIARTFLDLYDTLWELHACGIILGDFKPANILVRGHKAYVVDAESAAYGEYPCRTFTEGYIDPQICDPRLDYQVKHRPYTRTTDWYAFMVMFFEALTNLNPYSGVYLPPPGKKPVVPAARPLRGISVFNKGVRVPGFTESIAGLPEELQRTFRDIFEKGLRGMPRRGLLEALIPESKVTTFVPWEHTCWSGLPIDLALAAEKSPIVPQPFRPGRGELLACRVENDRPRCLILHEGALKRENGQEVVGGFSESDFNFFNFHGDVVLVGQDRDNTLGNAFDGPFYLIAEEGPAKVVEHVDAAPDGSPNIALQGNEMVWIYQGKLHRSDRERSLALFSGSLKLFSGDKFGLVITTSRSELTGIYLHDHSEVVRLISLPPIMGNVINTHCVFSEQVVWLFCEVEWEGQRTNYVLVIDDKGHLLGAGHSPGDAPWCKEATLKVAYSVTSAKNPEPRLAALVGDQLTTFECKELKVVPRTTKACRCDGEPVALIRVASEFHVALRRDSLGTMPPEQPDIPVDEPTDGSGVEQLGVEVNGTANAEGTV